MALGALILTMTNGQVAKCDQWYLRPTLRTQAVANDNVNLSPDKKEEVIGAVLSPQLQLGHRSDVLNLNLTGGADFHGYAVNSQRSSISERLAFLGAYNASELSTLSLGASFTHRDTISNNPEDNSGRGANNVRITTLSASPSWSYQFAELDQLSISAGYLKRLMAVEAEATAELTIASTALRPAGFINLRRSIPCRPGCPMVAMSPRARRPTALTASARK